MRTIRSILNSFIIVLLVACSRDVHNNNLNGEIVDRNRNFIDPISYPVFSTVEKVKWPEQSDSKRKLSIKRFGYEIPAQPDILPTDRWDASLIVGNYILFFSKEYNARYCIFSETYGDSKAGDCNKYGGDYHYPYLFINMKGEMLGGWQWLHNEKRFPVWEKESWVRYPVEDNNVLIFRCIERCDKLTNMR